MKKWKCAIICQIVLCTFILFLSGPGAAYGYDPNPYFEKANITFPAPDSVQAEQYLGLSAMKPFKLGQIKAKVVVIEFMSALCEFCSLNAKKMNSIYKTVQENPKLAPNVKVIAVGVSSTAPQLNAFKTQHDIPFPVLNDADAKIGMAMGDMPTPTTLIVSTATGKVLYSHVGLIWSADGFAKKIKDLIDKK